MVMPVDGSARPFRWPALREELQLHHGPSDESGQPTWTLQDPVRHRFLRIDWTTYEILRRWWMADPDMIVDEVNRQTTLHIGSEDVEEVLRLALNEELVHPIKPHASAMRPEHKGWRDGLQWLLHHYLFFRVPLIRPDRALGLILPWLVWLGGSTFTQLSLLALGAGLLGVVQQSEQLSAQWLDLLSWRGLALYGVTLVGVKIAHELGHALVAKHQGCRVPTMGVAFMVMWPVAYTDTTEAWRLADSRARLRIAAAGVRTELTIAAWATLAWTWLPDSPLRTALFILATMTWISTVLINLSPFMRFDGYFLLCDALDQPNLHERSFALARWWLRRQLLGWRAQVPEALSPTALKAMIAFALGTWAYRLSLYLGIAWMVYHFGFKAVGLILFVVEMGWFILGPLARELRHWREHRLEWAGQARAKHSAYALGMLVLAGFIPWSGHVTGAALVQPAQHLALRLPAAVTVEEILVRVGQTVQVGQPLLRTSVPALQQQQETAQTRVKQLERDLSAAAFTAEQQSQWGSLQASLATARQQIRSTEQELDRFQPKAPFDGVVVDLHPELQAGSMSPPPRETLLHLASSGPWRVVAYADEVTARQLAAGDRAHVGVDAEPLHHWLATIVSVAPNPSNVLAEPQLAQVHGGLVDARDTPAGWIPSQAIYRVELALQEPPPLSLRVWRGHVVFSGASQSLWTRLWNRAASAFIQEAGF